LAHWDFSTTYFARARELRYLYNMITESTRRRKLKYQVAYGTGLFVQIGLFIAMFLKKKINIAEFAIIAFLVFDTVLILVSVYFVRQVLKLYPEIQVNNT
jgi:hypothetical protein